MVELPLAPLVIRYGCSLLTAGVVLAVLRKAHLVNGGVIVLIAGDKNLISLAGSKEPPTRMRIQWIGMIQRDILDLLHPSGMDFLAQLRDILPGTEVRVDAIIVLHSIAVVGGTPGWMDRSGR